MSWARVTGGNTFTARILREKELQLAPWSPNFLHFASFRPPHMTSVSIVLG